MLQLKLKRFMRQHHITQAALAGVISDILLESGKSVSDRHLRYIVNNTEPLTTENYGKKPSYVVLGFIIKGLRELTGQTVTVSDVLEYQTLTPETHLTVVELPSELNKSDETNVLPTDGLELVPIISDVENEKTLDDIWELTVHTLEQRGHVEFSKIVATFNEASDDAEGVSMPKRERQLINLPILLSALLFVALGYIALDQFVFKPRLIAGASRLYSFSNRVRPTSDLPVPTLIGPEGEIAQLSPAPTLRISSVPKALAYEFYIEDTVSNDGFYSGSITSTTFVMPENSLCPSSTYAWRARALGNDGWTSFSSPLEFTISDEVTTPTEKNLLQLAKVKQPPELPQVIAPIGTTNTTTPTLEVAKASDVYGYGFYIRDLQSDGLVYDNNYVTDNAVQIPEGVLEDGGIYQWNVRSRNCHFWSEFSQPQVFTVNVKGVNP
jgi:hypothetical protein